MSIYKTFLSLCDDSNCEADARIKAFLLPYISARKALFARSAVPRRNRTLMQEKLNLLKYHSLLIQNHNKSSYVSSLYPSFGRRSRLARIRKNYKEAKLQYLAQIGQEEINDNEDFEMYIFSQMPQQVFSPDEIDLWGKIYNIATIQTPYEFTYRKRNNHRKINSQTNISFVEFVKFLHDNPSVQSNDVYFVAFYQKLMQCDDYTKRKVDYLLRYLSKRKYFSLTDIQSITGNSIPEEDFFDTISLISQSKKK